MTTTPSTAELRTWAVANGIKVADRGRISADVLDAWKSSHSSGGSTGPGKIEPVGAKPVAKSQRASKRTVVPATTKASAPSVVENDSRANKVEVLFEALEERVRALEQRLSEVNSAPAVKKRGLFRRSS